MIIKTSQGIHGPILLVSNLEYQSVAMKIQYINNVLLTVKYNLTDSSSRLVFYRLYFNSFPNWNCLKHSCPQKKYAINLASCAPTLVGSMFHTARSVFILLVMVENKQMQTLTFLWTHLHLLVILLVSLFRFCKEQSIKTHYLICL